MTLGVTRHMETMKLKTFCINLDVQSVNVFE